MTVSLERDKYKALHQNIFPEDATLYLNITNQQIEIRTESVYTEKKYSIFPP